MINSELKIGTYILLGNPWRISRNKSGLIIKSYYHHGKIIRIERKRFCVSLEAYKGSNFKFGQSMWFDKNEANYRIKK